MNFQMTAPNLNKTQKNPNLTIKFENLFANHLSEHVFLLSKDLNMEYKIRLQINSQRSETS